MEPYEIKQLDRKHVMHSWAVNESLDPLVIKDVEGVYLVDQDDRKMLDFSAQLRAVNVGYKNPKIIQAIQEQAGKICYLWCHNHRGRSTPATSGTGDTGYCPPSQSVLLPLSFSVDLSGM